MMIISDNPDSNAADIARQAMEEFKRQRASASTSLDPAADRWAEEAKENKYQELVRWVIARSMTTEVKESPSDVFRKTADIIIRICDKFFDLLSIGPQENKL